MFLDSQNVTFATYRVVIWFLAYGAKKSFFDVFCAVLVHSALTSILLIFYKFACFSAILSFVMSKFTRIWWPWKASSKTPKGVILPVCVKYHRNTNEKKVILQSLLQCARFLGPRPSWSHILGCRGLWLWVFHQIKSCGPDYPKSAAANQNCRQKVGVNILLSIGGVEYLVMLKFYWRAGKDITALSILDGLDVCRKNRKINKY